MNEEWRDIKGYEGLYKVSNLGRIKSYHSKCKRLYTTVINYLKDIGIILEPDITNKGYASVKLYKAGIRVKESSIHRLVAEAFLDNPDGLPEINHKDEVKTNNCVSNLEWCTSKYNINYGTRTQRAVETRRNKQDK